MRRGTLATGNCLAAALRLRARTPGSRLRVRWEGGLPFFYVVGRDGLARFLRYRADWGPCRWRLWWLWYRGEVVALPESKLKRRQGQVQAPRREPHGPERAPTNPATLEHRCAS